MHHKHHKHNPLCRPVIISALWQYIKTHKLQDQHEKEFVNCDPFLKQIFQVRNSKVDFSVLMVVSYLLVVGFKINVYTKIHILRLKYTTLI